MNPARMFLALLLSASLAFAGCLGGDAPDDDDTDPGDDGPPMNETPMEPQVFRGEGTVLVSSLIGGFGAPALDNIRVDAGATLLFAEIAWDDPIQDIDLALASPSAGQTGTAQNYDHRAEGGGPGMPNSPHILTVPTPESGVWMASAFASAVAAQVDYRVVVTVFYEETEVPEGYTGFEA